MAAPLRENALAKIGMVALTLSDTKTELVQPDRATPVLDAVRGAFFKALIRTSAFLIRQKRPGYARPILDWVTARQKPDRHVLGLVSRAYGARRSDDRITQYRVQHLNNLIEEPLKKKDFKRLLFLISRYEALEKNLPVKLGDAIGRQMVSDVGRMRISEAARIALKKAPESAFLIYLRATTLAKEGSHAEASALVNERIDKISRRKVDSPDEMKRIKKQFEILRNTWRVVDGIAREDMGWVDTVSGGTYAGLATEDTQVRPDASTQSWMLNFKEPLLQGRAEQAYLDVCRKEFDQGATLMIKLKVIKEMLRQGVRRQLTFHRAYAQANACFDETLPLLHKVMQVAKEEPNEKKVLLSVQTLSYALDICRSLTRTVERDEIKGVLVEIAKLEVSETAGWLTLPALVAEDAATWAARSHQVLRTLPARPQTENQLKAYLRWAIWTREFAAAERVFKQLPTSLQCSPGALYFVNILQRQSRFTEAMHAVKRVHAYMLSKPAQINPNQHWNLVRRYGELSFLRNTSNAYQKAPQPKKPKGVILLAARNIDQLRKYPLVVLMELKRRGWAVIPLVEGLLPREMTGNKKIDVLHGCVTLEMGLRPEAAKVFGPAKDFLANPSAGEITWKSLSLKHSITEDARINRRAYNVDFTCPALVTYLQRLCDWGERFAQASDYALKLFPAMKMRCGLMSLFNSRLPDSMFRALCEEYGDPHTFFCLHAANGYENYFTNFSTKISTRCVIRNVTAQKTVRSASLPDPELFGRYFELNKHTAEQVYSKVQHIANVRRSTGQAKELDPDAVACENSIMEWRANGGKVACLFGKVVCDAAVPYDGGPVHADLKDWLRHSIEAVRGSDTMLLIKPHPHELNEQIATYLNEYFTDLIDVELPNNVVIMGHRWFDIQALTRFVDLGLIYNGTTAIELALLRVPCVLCSHFAPIDYPVGHIVPTSRKHYEEILTFRSASTASSDLRERAALWLDYMNNSKFTIDYRYHTRPITNKVIYPPYWVENDLETYLRRGDRNVEILAKRAIGTLAEPSI